MSVTHPAGTPAHPPHRGSILVEDAVVVAHTAHADGQYTLTVESPRIVERVAPGHFVHLSCGEALKMRRPMSVMRVHPEAGTLEILYKVHGLGTDLLARQAVGSQLSMIGPIGQPFRLSGYRPIVMLIGGGVGIPPMVALAEHIREVAPEVRILACLGSEVRFPFEPRPSQILTPALPAEVTATMPLFEDWQIPTRLASHAGFAGCFEGFVTDLADHWLTALTAAEATPTTIPDLANAAGSARLEGSGIGTNGMVDKADIELYACGPTPMLAAVQRLAARHDLPAQLSLEEFMACAVGGCAGCTVPIRTDAGVAMRRVCVDGPVFEASTVIFDY